MSVSTKSFRLDNSQTRNIGPRDVLCVELTGVIEGYEEREKNSRVHHALAQVRGNHESEVLPFGVTETEQHD